MKTTLHIVKAHISKQKSATLSLFVILMVISALITISTSVLFGVASDFKAGRDRLNSLHSAFVMSRDIYSPSFEEIIREDPRVSQYDIGEVLFPSGVTVNYGGEVELMYGSLIFSLNQPAKLSAPKITEEDPDIPREEAIYLPKYAKGFGFNLGDPFTMTYRNRQIHFTVAAFFETSELGDAGNLSLKFFVPHECYERLTQWFARSVWIAIRFYDDNDSVLFNRDFAKKIDLEHSSFAFERDSIALSTSALTPVSVFSAIVVIFALLLSFISMLVIRFRVSNSIENAMHEIGVLEASGYTSLQIIGSYLAEYGILSFLSGSLGVFLSIPVFPAIRQVLSSLTGTSWTLHSDIKAGIVSVLLITAILQMMIWRSCRKIKLLPPVAALRGGVAANGSKRNFFPLHKGGGNVHTRLGLKNMLVFSKTYALIGLVIAGISLAVVFMAITYQNFVYHHTALAKLTGHELSDVSLIVARHTDADAMAAQIEQMPQVRRTSMLDYANIDIEDLSIEGMVSSDFGRLESMSAKEGRFPKYDNEVALPKITAAKMGKGIGDSVNIKAKGVSLPYII
ncbi:MAG: ABC transporter permease, partial [Peptococcaceae bacterium]|nr:ABC transporter permease [Peptococcaceae bacterium]